MSEHLILSGAPEGFDAELIARVRALVRRSAGLSDAVLRFGALTLDTRRMQVNVAGKDIALSPLEYRFIHALAHSRGRPLSATDLSEALHGTDALEANAIEALVALGYSASEAAGAVRKLQVTEEMSVEDILKLSLKNL